MSTRLSLKTIAVAALACVASASASASPVGTFFNTGVDGTQLTLPNGAAEIHYTLASTPDGSSPGLRVATGANGFPIGPWLSDNSSSTWIGPNTDSALNGPAGSYDYRTTFDLTGFNSATATLVGQWATDDAGVDILINGTSAGQTAGGFSSFTPFSITSGFIDGLNTLDFIVINGGGPTGLRVEGTLTANVPEPASMALLGAGLLAAGVTRRLRA